jgi:hypothetical protein
MDMPFAPGAHSQNSGPHEEPPASHVGRPHSSQPPRLDVQPTVGNWSIEAMHLVAGHSDVLPDRVRPKAEPTEESESEATGKARRKGPRRRGR